MSTLKNLIREIHRRSLWQVLSIYLFGGWAALAAVDTLTGSLGLPEWFPPFALGLLIVGLPIVLATAFVQEGVGGSRTAGGDVETSEGEAASAGPMDQSPRTAHRLLTWRNAIAGGVMAFALWGVVAAVYMLWLRPPPLSGAVAVGAEVVAVLPFNVAGDPGLTGEGMVDLLSSSIDQVGPIRTVAAQTLLARWEQAAAGGRPDLDAMLAMGRQAGAGSVLTGSVVTAGSDVRIDATLHAVTGDLLARTQVSGSSADLLSLVDSLSLGLLREIWRSQAPIPHLQVSAISTGSLDAIRAYLDGVAFYRESRYPEAVDALNRAIEADSAFALAHHVIAQVYGWTAAFAGGRAERLRRRNFHAATAVQHADRLPERETSMVLMEQVRLAGDGAAYQDSLEAFLQRYPDEPNAWYRLGDQYFHTFEGLFVSPVEAMEPFERVVSLDPTAGPLHSHLWQLLLAHGDRERYRRSVAALEQAGDPTAPDRRALEAVIWDTDDPHEAVGVLSSGAHDVLNVTYALAFRRQHRVADVADALDSLAARLPLGSASLPDLATARGRLRRAMGQLRRARAIEAEAGWTPWDAYVESARPVLAGTVGPEFLLPDPGPTEADPQNRHLWLAMASAASGDAAAARRHVDLGVAAIPDFERPDFEGLYAATLGLVALAEGDSAMALESIEAGLSSPNPGGNVNAVSGSRDSTTQDPLLFALGALWVTRPEGRARGLQILRKPWIASPEYEVLARYHIGKALEASGDAEGARQAYSWFVDTLADADPGLPVHRFVADARAALERLGTE
jgi:tetratricopeptide (TPR) repeat protein